ncbi:CARDB domain-containing protein [Haloarcula salinisoli]|uniref:CARDB domain-containing protein n=1 Tax=Haloarcula salinisoli TaxID=2487746 RepID=A0A8J7YJ30_9EURY|nr:CARDB domain-containing protein [Halomicroarcula salinisoli]MBX0302781.1 hypothetical protein [Halomicroarcula salinisoli]
MRRLIVAALVVLAAVPPVVAGTQANGSITGVTVSPQSPAPNETVTFTPTIRNLQGSGDALIIDSVELRPGSSSGLPVYTRVRNVGTLSPGAEVTVPLTYTFEEPGTRDLRVYVDARNANTSEPVELRYPVSLSVRERQPQLDIQTDDSVAGVASNGSVEIANGLDTSISNVEVTVSGDGVTVLEDRSVFASVPQGATETAEFRFRPQRAGTDELRATINYTLPSGTERTVTQTRTIETEAARSSVVLETSQSGSGSDQTLAVDIINQGNTRAEDIVVTGRSENATVSRTIVDAVPPSSTEQVRLNASLLAASADVVVTADYESASVQRSVETTRTLRATPAAIELTGLDISREDGVLQITGSTSNVGTTMARSVTVRVLPGENVEPAAPNRDFFVGEVPGSDFSSFDLTARTTGNVSEIPLEVSYLVEGERTKETFSVPVDSGLSGEPERQASGGPGAVLLAVLGLGAVTVLVVAGFLVRRYRRGDDDVDL